MVSKQSTEPRSKLEEELSNLFLLGMKGEKQEYKHFLNVLSKYLRGYFYKKNAKRPRLRGRLGARGIDRGA